MTYVHTGERPLSYAEAILVRGGCPYQALATATDRSETVMLVCSVCHADNTFPFDQGIDQAI
ncbi:uncharacterized protein Bfra_010983 [Botrytis fragariae]|uniref:Uncharacterized protein n=1 Tax=Botrytis fragariae TaxID=1964551 RepID=A0A8H6AL90_9HELO|nr:uncharacterized protein Bfra_010983 [Botrytis fragariae]KAF5869783.1 hypothetical protein Bfra_010983 [Botrytis fragariae]